MHKCYVINCEISFKYGCVLYEIEHFRLAGSVCFISRYQYHMYPKVLEILLWTILSKTKGSLIWKRIAHVQRCYVVNCEMSLKYCCVLREMGHFKLAKDIWFISTNISVTLRSIWYMEPCMLCHELFPNFVSVIRIITYQQFMKTIFVKSSPSKFIDEGNLNCYFHPKRKTPLFHWIQMVVDL